MGISAKSCIEKNLNIIASNIISLSDAKANNGQWHTVKFIRSGQWIQLKMDSGEGRYFNETFGNQQDSVGFYLRKDRIVSGSRVVYDPSTRFEGRGLVDSKTIYHYICKRLYRTCKLLFKI
jgi:hypothetical protein